MLVSSIDRGEEDQDSGGEGADAGDHSATWATMPVGTRQNVVVAGGEGDQLDEQEVDGSPTMVVGRLGVRDRSTRRRRRRAPMATPSSTRPASCRRRPTIAEDDGGARGR